MAATELARMLFAANTILEKASSSVGLSKRAALALAILFLEDDPGAALTNREMHERFVTFNVSSGLSAKKDVSAAKSELLRLQYIEIREKMSKFGLTPKGRDVVSRMNDALAAAIDELGLSKRERSILRELAGLPDPQPKPPTSEGSDKSARRKSS
jgi:hypothetical protein